MFNWQRLFSLRNRALLMVGITLLSFLSAFTPIFTQSASAVSPEDVLNRARAWSILNAIIDHRSLIDSTVSNDEIDQCDIFGADDNDAVYVGAAVTGNPDAGEQSWENVEENTSILNGALASVGIDRGCRGLLEAIGYQPTGDGLEQPDDFGNRLSSRIREALDNNAFFGANIGDGSPGPALSYALLYYNLINVCGWGFRNSFTDNSNPTYKSRNDEARVNGWDGEPRNRHFHTYTYEQGKAGDNTYYRGGGRDDDIRVGSKTGFASSGNNDATIDCADSNGDTIPAKLADNHRFADAYAKLIKPGGDTTAGTCLDRYEGRPTLLAACDDGFTHRGGDPKYCENKYPIVPIEDTNAALREACAYGLQTATGDSSQSTPPPGSEEGEGNENATSCIIEGVGWIICPAVNFIAKVTDGTYSILSNLLEVQPLNVNGESGLYNAWAIMRNFANIAFVIAFLVIVFSQITNVGINNYGIKKMLPKLVISAILVNISYWICAIAVDLSNIAGSSLYSLLNGLKDNVGPSLPEIGTFSTGDGWAGFVGTLLAGGIVTGALFFVSLSVLLPILVTVLATIVTVFLGLVLRQALIIILIVLSPLAFVALAFQKDNIFNNARGALVTLLAVYPVVAVLFAGAGLASAIIISSSDQLYIQIAGAGVSVIPLLLAAVILNGINKVAQRFGLPNMQVRMEGLKKRAKETGEELEDRRATAALTGGNAYGAGWRHKRAYRRQMRRQAGEAKLKSAQSQFGVTDPTTKGYVAAQTQAQQQMNAVNAANTLRAVSSVANNPSAVSAGMNPQAASNPEVQRALAAQQQKAIADAIRDAQLTATAEIKPGDITEIGSRLEQAIRDNDSITARALQNMLLTSGSPGIGQYRETMTNLGSTDPALMGNEAATRMRENLLQNHGGIKSSAADLTAHAADTRNRTLGEVSTDDTTWNLSDDELVKQKTSSIKLAVKSGAVSQDRAADIMDNSELYDKLAPEIKRGLTDWAASPPGTKPEDIPEFK